jgi:hypothetical protein
VCSRCSIPPEFGDVGYQFIIKIVVRVLVFIKEYQARVRDVQFIFTLVAGFVPHLQVAFHV